MIRPIQKLATIITTIPTITRMPPSEMPPTPVPLSALLFICSSVRGWTSASIQQLPGDRQNYSGSGASSPGHLPVTLANEVRLPWSTRPLVRRKIAPSTASAAISFGQADSRCSGFGGSSSSISLQTCSKNFLPAKPAISPRTMLTGVKINFTCDSFLSGGLLILRLVARFELDLLLGPRLPFVDLGAALALGVHLVAEEDRQIGDPEPEQQHDEAAEGAVGLVVGAEVGDVEGEQGRGDRPDHDRKDGARRHPFEAAQLDVRGRVVEEVDHEDEDGRHHRPLGDVPDVHGGAAEADRIGDGFDDGAGEPEADGKQRHD